MDYRQVIRPLLEKNMLNAKEGEVILDKNTGHITLKHEGKYKSKTKELEARVNALLGYKNQLVKKFLELADEIEILVKGLDQIKKDTNEIKRDSEELYHKLIELEVSIDALFRQIDRFVLDIKDFQYRDLRFHLDPIIANLREVLKLRAIIDELKFLANDIFNQKASNSSAISNLGQLEEGE